MEVTDSFRTIGSFLGSTAPVLSAAFAALAATAAWRNVVNASRHQRLKRESRRPYLAVMFAGLSSDRNLEISFKNAGGRPAKDVFVQFVLLHPEMAHAYKYKHEQTLGNDLTPGFDWCFRQPGEIFEDPQKTRFIAVHVSYGDPVLQKRFSQEFCYRWVGRHSLDGVINPVHYEQVTAADRLRLLAHLERNAPGDFGRDPDPVALGMTLAADDATPRKRSGWLRALRWDRA